MKVRIFTAGLLFTCLGISACFGQGAEKLKHPRVLVCPVFNLDRKGLPAETQSEARQQIADEVQNYLALKIKAAGGDTIKAVDSKLILERLTDQKLKKTKGMKSIMADLSDQSECDLVLFVEIDRWTQRDRNPDEILSSRQIDNASETGAEPRVWIYNFKENLLSVDGDSKTQPFQAKIGGPFFGSQKKGELFGNPEDVSKMIQFTNKRRSVMIGKAVWTAIKPALGVLIELPDK